MALGMIFQTLYYLVDLYFVARLGDAAVAGVSAAGNVQFIIMSFTQILGVSTMALIAHAVGRKDQPDANLLFNQSVLWAFVCGIGTLVIGYALCGRYMSGAPTCWCWGSRRRPPCLRSRRSSWARSRGISWPRGSSLSGLLFTCGGMFQALGNTVPSLIASGTRLLTFAVPVWWLSHRAGFQIKQVWYLSVLTMTLQAAFALWLLRRELQRKELKMASVRLAV